MSFKLMINPYVHQIQYYETDKMGITNNANYVRFMEEARSNYLEQIGCSYASLEKNGIISPVVKIRCEYLKTTTYPDRIVIWIRIVRITHFKLVLRYLMKVKGVLVCKAKSEHCFLNKAGNILNIPKQLPSFYHKLRN